MSLYRLKRQARKRSGDGEGETAIWLVTFTDTIALMLTFFVMTYAMSNPQVDRWQSVADTFTVNFSRFQGEVAGRGDQDTINIARINYEQALELSYLEHLLGSALAGQTGLHAVTINRQPDRIVLSLPQDLLFARASAAVSDEGSRALYSLAMLLQRVKNRIEIVGHTDPEAVSGPSYASNWDLSLARAAAVAGALETAGYTKQVTIRGQASGLYEALADAALSEDERLALARRVDLVIMEDDGNRVTIYDIQ